MIPQAYITQWRSQAPWVSEDQVEQDLVLSKAIVQIFQHKSLSDALALRGGTAFNKFFLDGHARYSEDIDLVQVKAEAIGPVLSSLRSLLDPWLGEPSRDRSKGTASLRYRFQSEAGQVMGLKVEINTREHFTVFGYQAKPLQVKSPWFDGEAEIRTYVLDELLGTKMRALYQRRKGRDLFDLWRGLQIKGTKEAKIVEAFKSYIKHEGHSISHEEYQANLDAKLGNKAFLHDLRPLLATGMDYDPLVAMEMVKERLLPLV